ncbi:MAG: CDP-glucose 4,6-dehydratase [Bacilli bacterium]
MDLSFYKGKKVFITGNTGFKGSWLSKILLMAGADVLGYALEPNTEPNLYTILNLEGQMKTITGDIRDYKLLYKSLNEFNPDIVIHLAAQPIVRESYKNPTYTYETNVMGTVNILEAIRNISSVKSFLNVTTDKVYLNKEWEYGYRECDELCGYDPYSNSKSCSELVTYSYVKSFFNDKEFPRISTGRSGNVIGGGDFSIDRIIPDSIKAYFDKETIKIRNPYSTRPYQHVLDCLNGYLTLIEKQYDDKSMAGNYNFGPNDESCVSTGDLVTKFCVATGNKVAWENMSDGGPHEANFLKLDCSKTKKNLGWTPKWTIDKAIEKIVEWSNEYQNNEDMNKVTEKQIEEFFKF